MAYPKREIFGSAVAVIGGAGFLGSHMVRHLIENRGCKVLVIDNLITGQKRFLPDSTMVEFEHFDITHSEEHMRKLFVHHNIKYVFNYAAEPYIPVSFERPLHVFDINAMGALKVMNAAQEAGVKGILQVSSAEIYGESTHGALTEQALVKPHSTYGVAKAAIDSMVQVRWREAKTPAIALRQFNCIGERETHPYVVPEIIKQVHEWRNNGRAVVKLGNNSVRDLQYAGDAVRMAALLLEHGEFGEVYNMGSEEAYHIYDLAKLIGKLMEVKVTVEEDKKRMRPWEIWHLRSNNRKLYKAIGGKPKNLVGTIEGLKRTIHWFESNGHQWDF